MPISPSRSARRWEYTAIRTDFQLGQWYELGTPKWVPDAHDTIATLGEQGWELVNVTEDSGGYTWFFKRLLP